MLIGSGPSFNRSQVPYGQGLPPTPFQLGIFQAITPGVQLSLGPERSSACGWQQQKLHGDTEAAPARAKALWPVRTHGHI